MGLYKPAGSVITLCRSILIGPLPEGPPVTLGEFAL